MKHLLLLLLLFPYTTNVWSQTGNNNPLLKPAVQALTDSMVAYNALNGSAVGYGGERTAQWERFERLKKIATTRELEQLTDHNNAVVRCYAFDALRMRRDYNIMPVLVKHLKDNDTVEWIAGCFFMEDPVAAYMLRALEPGNQLAGERTLNQAEFNFIDSILLADTSITMLQKDNLVVRMKPGPQQYEWIKRIAAARYYPPVLVVLASYQQPDDLVLLQKLFSDSTAGKYAMLAAERFPHQSFYPFLQRKAELHYKRSTDGYYAYTEILYGALAAYPTQNTVDIFTKIMSVKESRKHWDICRAIYKGISRHPAPIFLALKKTINITKKDKKEIMEELTVHE